MQQIKLFIDIESQVESLEAMVNDWLKKSGAKVVNIFGNIAAQTVTPEAKSASLGTRKFSSSDLFIVVVYEAD